MSGIESARLAATRESSKPVGWDRTRLGVLVPLGAVVLVAIVCIVVAALTSAQRADDVAELKGHGFSDAEVFDIAAVAAGRAFFAKVVESLGVATDAPLRSMDPSLRDALTIGRPVRFVEPDRLDEPEFRAVG